MEARIWTKAASRMLNRRRLEIIKKLVAKYGLLVDIMLVASECSLVDWLTLVLQRWYDMLK